MSSWIHVVPSPLNSPGFHAKDSWIRAMGSVDIHGRWANLPRRAEILFSRVVRVVIDLRGRSQEWGNARATTQSRIDARGFDELSGARSSDDVDSGTDDRTPVGRGFPRGVRGRRDSRTSGVSRAPCRVDDPTYEFDAPAAPRRRGGHGTPYIQRLPRLATRRWRTKLLCAHLA